MKQELTNKKLKNQHGITLIALVITIVILLILAGITINMLFGENGILARAKNADNTMKNAQQKDLDELDRLSNWIDEKTNTSNGGSTGGDDTQTPPAKKVITFTFYRTTYQAEEGMTWLEWENSKYFPEGATLEETTQGLILNQWYCIKGEKYSNIIQDGKEYEFEPTRTE